MYESDNDTPKRDHFDMLPQHKQLSFKYDNNISASSSSSNLYFKQGQSSLHDDLHRTATERMRQSGDKSQQMNSRSSSKSSPPPHVNSWHHYTNPPSHHLLQLNSSHSIYSASNNNHPRSTLGSPTNHSYTSHADSSTRLFDMQGQINSLLASVEELKILAAQKRHSSTQRNDSRSSSYEAHSQVKKHDSTTHTVSSNGILKLNLLALKSPPRQSLLSPPMLSQRLNSIEHLLTHIEAPMHSEILSH